MRSVTVDVGAGGRTDLSSLRGFGPSARVRAALAVVCLVGAACAIAVLASLPYSTSRIVRVENTEALSAPGADGFALGPLRWDLSAYRTSPSLEAFRTAFEPECAGRAGLEAARCVSDRLMRLSPRGIPSAEFVDPGYDPVAALKLHLAGQPGHCTVRASMTATALLAMGHPARVVQVLPTKQQRGHNLLEVWDAQNGWLLFDPYFDSSLLHDGAFVPAARLGDIASGLHWRRPHPDSPDPNVAFGEATVQYPEPWLYTRVGQPQARWPFRASFAQVGQRQFSLGPAQSLALGIAALLGVLAMAAALSAVRASSK